MSEANDDKLAKLRELVRLHAEEMEKAGRVECPRDIELTPAHQLAMAVIQGEDVEGLTVVGVTDLVAEKMGIQFNLARQIVVDLFEDEWLMITGLTLGALEYLSQVAEESIEVADQ